MSQTVIQVIVNENDISDIKTIEIPATAFQALNFKRVDFVKFKNDYDVSKPGVYLLLGQNKDEMTKLYIGETTNLKDRLTNHYRNKDWWNEAIVFYSKNNEISSSHIKYVESKLISIVNPAVEMELENGKSQILPKIDFAGEIIANKYLENLLFLLSALRFDYFTNTDKTNSKISADLENEKVFILKVGSAEGKMKRLDGQYVILKGSTAKTGEHPSTSDFIVKVRNQLVQNGVLVKNKLIELYDILEDIPCETSSKAGCIISGHNTSGPQKWIYNGKTLKEIEQEESK